MSKRTRIHPVQFYLNDDEQYILEEKYRLSRMKSKSAFLRKMILYGFVYEVDYYSIHLVIIVYSYLLFCYTPFKKQFWRIRNATLSCYTY